MSPAESPDAIEKGLREDRKQWIRRFIDDLLLKTTVVRESPLFAVTVVQYHYEHM